MQVALPSKDIDNSESCFGMECVRRHINDELDSGQI